MKNIYKTLALVLLVFTWSCEQDDTVANENLLAVPEQVMVSFTDQNNDVVVLEDGGRVTLDVSLDKGLPYDAILSLDITSSDGSIETTAGVPEVDYTSSVNLTTGQTDVSFDIVFADDGLNDGNEEYTVKIANLESASGMYTPDVFLLGGDLTRVITVVDSLPLTVVTSTGSVGIVLDWATFEDLDLYLRDEPGFAGGSPNIDFSWYSQPEVMSLASNLGDGTYYIGVDNFLVDPPYSVACTLTLNFPGESSEVILTELNETTWIQVDKSTNGSEVTYSIYN